MKDAWQLVFRELYLIVSIDVLDLTSALLDICTRILDWVASKIPEEES